MSRTFTDLRAYLTASVEAFFQLEGHPSLPIVLSAVTHSRTPSIKSNKKEFGSIEHLFHHYNKYIAGGTLDPSTYLKSGGRPLFQHIVFQEGPYDTLSVSKTLELSPAEWADRPDLVPVAESAASPLEELNTITYKESTETNPSVKMRKTANTAKEANQLRIAALHSRCDAIEHGIDELKASRIEMEAELTKLEETTRRVEALARKMEETTLILTKMQLLRTLNNLQAKICWVAGL